MNLAMERLNEQIDILNNDFKLHKRTLKNYINVDDYERYVIKKEEDNLQPEFERASEKCLSVKTSRFEPVVPLKNEPPAKTRTKDSKYNNVIVKNNFNNRNRKEDITTDYKSNKKNNKSHNDGNDKNYNRGDNNIRANNPKNKSARSNSRKESTVIKRPSSRVFFNSNANKEHRASNFRSRSHNSVFRKRQETNLSS